MLPAVAYHFYTEDGYGSEVSQVSLMEKECELQEK